MTQKDLNKLLNFIQEHPSEESDEITAIVLKMGLDLVAKNKPKNVPAQTNPNILKFTKKEIDSMSEPVKILLIYSGYEIKYSDFKNIKRARFRRNGYNIEVSAKSIDTLRTKFLNAIENAQPKQRIDTSTPFLKDFIEEWLQTKKHTLKESTYKSYINLITAHIVPNFGEKRLKEITRSDIQDYINGLVEAEKYRTAQKLRQLLAAIFDVAVDDYNFKSPMTKVVVPRYEVKKGNALTLSEERTVVDYCILHRDNPVFGAILILMYTGMRVGELVSAVLHDNYIECETEKTRKGYAKEFRKIPISPMLRKVMPYIDFEKSKNCNTDYINRSFQKILSEHHAHELRYTFITRAKEAGCNLELVMLWDGHKLDKEVKSSAVDRGYTDYSNEYYFKEIEKINYEL